MRTDLTLLGVALPSRLVGGGWTLSWLFDITDPVTFDFDDWEGLTCSVGLRAQLSIATDTDFQTVSGASICFVSAAHPLLYYVFVEARGW